MTGKPAFMWCDLETSGLAIDVKIIEAGFIVTDADLNELATWAAIISPPEPVAFEPDAGELHRQTGFMEIWEQAEDTFTYEQAWVSLRAWSMLLESRLGVPTTDLPLAGSTIGFDRRVLLHEWPAVHDLFHYRNIDVSTIKELCNHWRHGLYQSRPKDHICHRVLEDIRDSIAELDHYRLLWDGGLARQER